MKKSLLSVPSKLSSFCLRALVISLFSVGITAASYAQVATNYVFSESNATAYADLVPNVGTSVTVVSGDFTGLPGAPTNYALPFAFNFNGTTVTNVYVSDNGFVTFNSASSTPASDTSPISIGDAYAGAVACYGFDLGGLAAAGATITCGIEGTAPNRVFVVQYKNVQRLSSLLAYRNGLMNMQIRLYETTFKIETWYSGATLNTPFTSTSAVTVSGQVGLRGSANTDFNNRQDITNAIWPATDAGTLNTHVLRTLGQAGGVAVRGYKANTCLTWIPCFAPSAITAVLQPDNSTAVLSWTAPVLPPSGGYNWEVRTSGNPGSGSPFDSGTAASSPVSVLNLVPNITYYFYVKSVCSNTWLPTNTHPSSLTITPTCTLGSFPYTENFESVTTPGTAPYTTTTLPVCTARIINTSNVDMVTRNSALEPLNYGFTNKNLITVGNNAADVWYFTKGIPIPAAGSYRLSYKYGGTREQDFFRQKMKVYYGSAASVVGMTTMLVDHDDIKDSPLTNVINFTVGAAGTYYLGFNAYGAAAQGSIQLDDINLDVTTCLVPTGLLSGQLATSTAVIAWTAVASATTGYQYYVAPAAGALAAAGSFSIGQTYQIKTIGTTNYTLIGAASNTVGVNFVATGAGAGTGTAQLMIIPPTAPSSSVVVTGNVGTGVTIANLSGLTPSTIYDFWVRSNCGGGDYSQWSVGGTFTTKPLVTYCSPNGFGFSQDPRGITNVTMGSINNTTGIETNNYGNYSSLTTNVAQGATLPVKITNATGFTYDTTIWVDWNNDGDFNDAGEIVYTGVMPQPNPSILNLTFVVPALDSDGNSTLGPHRIRIGGIDYGPTNGSPIDDNPFNNACRTGRYQVFEDYTLYVITSPPALTISAATDTICEGFSTLTPVTVTSTVSDFQVYTWSPASGVSGSIGAGYTFNPTATTTYTLTATQTSGNFSSNSASFTVTVNAKPTPITVTPSSATYCNGSAAQALVATGGVVTGIFNTVFEENFNDPTNTFTTVNTSTGGTVGPAAAAWTLYASGATNSRGTSYTSNDSSQYYMSDSDEQGQGGTTRTQLISPSFSLVGFVDASLSFWHFFDYLDHPANVEISTDGGATWLATPLASYTSDQGSGNNFSQATLNLTPYIGQANLKIRFRYVDATWDWSWAVDNVKVFGSGTSVITWSPTTELFTDAAATIAYTGTALSTVYTKPTGNRVYTANSVSSLGCSTNSSPVTITFSSPTAGTASSNQNICSGIPADLTVAGYAGSVTKWQYCPNASFSPIGSVVDIPSSNSATLTSAQMGVLSSDRYYRAVTTSGGCTTSSLAVAITITKTIWTGSWSAGEPNSTIAAEFQEDYISSANTPLFDGNLSACSVIISNGADVSFDIGTLTVQNAVTVTSGLLTIEDNASLYQVQAVANGPGVYSGGNSGIVTSKRVAEPMYKFDYTYWSSPVNPQNLLAVSPASPLGWFLTYNATTNAWQYVTTPSTTTMEVGRGYLIRAPINFPISPALPLDYTASFSGVPNNGTFTTPIVGGAAQLNLIGNPYPSALNAPDFINGNPNINGTLYFWTHNTPLNPVTLQYAANDYAIYNLVGGTLQAPTVGAGTSDLTIPLGNIASGQGFFVKGLSNGTATFSNSMRRAGLNTQFYKTNTRHNDDTSLEKHRYWIDIANSEGAFKQVLIGYVETATTGLDRLFDGDMVDIGNAITLYTTVEDIKLSIQGRPLPFDVNETIPLGYKSTIDGTYTISLSHYDGLFDTQHVYIEDTALNVIHDLRVSPYSFATVLGTFDNRFILRYTNTALGIPNPVFTENSVIVYKNDQGLFIDSGAVNMATVNIFDIRGRLLATQKQVDRTTTVFTTLPTTNQVLLVRIEAENGAIVTKKVVY